LVGESWPAGVGELTDRLHKLESERRFAPLNRRAALAAEIRLVASQIEAAN
jgi:hypothetical protein